MTLSILGIDKKSKTWQMRKTVLVYLLLSVTAIAVDNIYALFGHGVRSAFMSWMFLYPLVGGAFIYFLIERFAPKTGGAEGYRLFYNIYNSGIAVLTVGSFLKGILEIAGTTSVYTEAFFITGWLLIGTGILLFLFKPMRSSMK